MKKFIIVLAIIVVGLIPQVVKADQLGVKYPVATTENQSEEAKALAAGYSAEQYQNIMNIPDFSNNSIPQLRGTSSVSAFSASPNEAGTIEQQKVVNEAMKYIGVPYVWGGKSPSGFDCSGLVQYVFSKALNMNVPAPTTNQERLGTEVSLNNLKPGDLLFYGSRGSTYHVGIYIGNGQMIHAPKPGETVTVLDIKWWSPDFARRVIQTGTPIKPNLPEKNPSEPFTKTGINYESHVSKMGWMNNVTNGNLSGTVGYGLSMEAIKINFGNTGIEGSVQYKVHVAGKGWLDWVNNGEIAGTTGQGTAMQAIQIRLTGEAANCYDIYYQSHVENKGWLDWVQNGQTSGTTGQGLSMQAIKIKLVKKHISQGNNTLPMTGLAYRSHLENEGWLGYVTDNQLSGTTGMGISMQCLDVYFNGSKDDIHMDAQVQNKGWINNSGGTVGQGLQLEAVKLSLSDNLSSKYSIVYRVHVAGKGWLNWVKDGDVAGTVGEGKAIQAIEIHMVPK